MCKPAPKAPETRRARTQWPSGPVVLLQGDGTEAHHDRQQPQEPGQRSATGATGRATGAGLRRIFWVQRVDK